MDQPVIKPKITRRMFLKTSATVAAVAAAGELLTHGRAATFISDASAQSAPKQDGWYPGMCKFCMQGDCITRVHVVDGVVVKVEGDPRAPNNQGRLCPRGNSAIVQMYNPWRMKGPLKRTNPQKSLGVDPQFVEISWEEANSVISEKFQAIRDSDPRKLMLVTGFGQIAADFTAMSPWMRAFGSPNNIPSRGQACAYHHYGGAVHAAMPDAVVDMDYTNFIINIGRTQGPNIAVASSGTSVYLDVLARGGKIYTVDPRCSPEAAKSTEWIPIKPATDFAFVAAFLNVMFYEIGLDKLDVWSIKNRTNGPYLISPDGDYVFDADGKKPLVWDAVVNQAGPFDTIDPMNMALEGTFTVNGVQAVPAYQKVKESVKDYSPEWAESICTIPAAKTRQLAKEYVEAAQIGSTTTIDGFTFPLRPVGFMTERGSWQHPIVGPWCDGMAKIIAELVGALEVPGGMTGNQTPNKSKLEPGEDGVKNPLNGTEYIPWTWPPETVDSHIFYPLSHTLPSLAVKAILDPETYHIPYNIESIISGGGNPIHANFNRDLCAQAWAKVPFVVSMSLIMDETAQLADIVLPEDSMLEREQFEFSLLQVMQPHKVMTSSTRTIAIFGRRDTSAIRKVYNSHDVFRIFMDLAEKLGILTGEKGMLAGMNGLAGGTLDLTKRPSIHELGDAIVKANFGKSIDEINDASGPVYKYKNNNNSPTGKENYNYYFWPDNTTRYPMYMAWDARVGKELKANMEKAGLTTVPGWKPEQMDYYWQAYSAVPVWVPTAEYSAPAEYDLWAFNWKTPMAPFYCGDTYGNVWLHETMKTWDPYEYNVLINSATAAKKGLKDGDTIVIESRYGKTQGTLKTTELIHPAAVGIAASHGASSLLANPITKEGPYFNALCPFHESDGAIDVVSGGIEEAPAVKVYKA
jgi:anaerobic selenocysteine-containing dehydrogenase